MTTRPSVKVGMRVVAADGDDIGTVKDVRGNDILVDRPMSRDVYVPYDDIRDVTDDTITLSVTSDRLDAPDWPKPPVL